MTCPRYGKVCFEIMCGFSINGKCTEKKGKNEVRVMKKSERNEIYEKVAKMSDNELLKFAGDALYDCLGSVADVMDDMGYDIIDVVERRKYEKYLSEKADILIMCCDARGIDLFEGKE